MVSRTKEARPFDLAYLRLIYSTEERCRSGTQSAYFFPDISWCSSSLLSVSALRGLYSRGTSS
jgi:hypothetical protein